MDSHLESPESSANPFDTSDVQNRKRINLRVGS